MEGSVLTRALSATHFLFDVTFSDINGPASKLHGSPSGPAPGLSVNGEGFALQNLQPIIGASLGCRHAEPAFTHTRSFISNQT